MSELDAVRAELQKQAKATIWSPSGGGRAIARGLDLLLGQLAPAAPPSPTPAPTPVPAPAPASPPLNLRSRWGLYQDGMTAASVAAYEKWLGRPVDVVLRYANEQDGPGPAIPNHRSMWSPKWRMDTPTADSVIVGFCRQLVASGQADTILRPYWEPDGNWMTAWYYGTIPPATWIARWRHTVDLARSVAGQAFKFEWNTNITADGGAAALIESYCPGDDYFDIPGMDLYSRYPKDSGVDWKVASAGLDWLKKFAAAHGKPYGFSEYGVFPGVNDPLFMQTILPYILDPACAYANYFEGRDPGLGVDFRLSNRASQSGALLQAAA